MKHRSNPQRGAPLDSVFAALADPTRRAIVARLARGECTVSVLAKPFRVSAPAISKHLRVLEASGLMARRIEGRIHYCRLRPNPLLRANQWMSEQQDFWKKQFESLARYLERDS